MLIYNVVLFLLIAEVHNYPLVFVVWKEILIYKIVLVF
jgi:hypothetical protein